jgi:hypothetical protein
MSKFFALLGRRKVPLPWCRFCHLTLSEKLSKEMFFQKKMKKMLEKFGGYQVLSYFCGVLFHYYTYLDIENEYNNVSNQLTDIL